MASPLRIYHNPKCSKSRAALAALRERGLAPEVVEYLKTPPSAAELKSLVTAMGVAPSSLIRTKDFAGLGLTMSESDDEILQQIADNPVILARPIVVCGARAGVARELERLDWILGDVDAGA